MPHLVWQQWVLVVAFGLEAIGYILTIGDSRPARTRGQAAVNVVITAFLVWLVVSIR